MNPRKDRSPERPWHVLDRSAIEEILSTSAHGLDAAEVEGRFTLYGPNALEEAPPPNPLAIFLHQFRSPLIYILLVATVVTLFLGEYIDAGVIGAVLVLNAIIGFVQEYRAEHSVRAWCDWSRPGRG
jgi:magnesium-transporting ATPase (P-type)